MNVEGNKFFDVKHLQLFLNIFKTLTWTFNMFNKPNNMLKLFHKLDWMVNDRTISASKAKNSIVTPCLYQLKY